MLSVQTAPEGRSIWHAVKQDTFVTNISKLLLASKGIAGDPKIYQEQAWRPPKAADQNLSYVLPLEVEHQLADDLAFLAATQRGPYTVSAATISEVVGGHGCTVNLAANEGVPQAVESALRGVLEKLQERAKKEISYEDCRESLFESVIKLSRERIHARLRSNYSKKPLTEKLWARSTLVLMTSTTRENKTKLQDIARKIKALHELYLDMEKANPCEDMHFLKQITRQASGLSAPAPSLEASLIACGVSGDIASSNMIRRVDKVGRYWAACSTLVKLASTAKYRTLLAAIQLLPIASYRTHTWPLGSKKRRHVHAEVQLVTHHRLHPSDLPPRVVGISKASCYLCDLFLSQHKQYYFSGSHGKIYEAWTVPDLVEYTVPDVTELRQIIRAINSKLLETEPRMRKLRAKRQSTPKEDAYESFIWPTPYQASTPPLSMRDDHSVAAISRTITPLPAGSIACTPPSLAQIRHDKGDAADHMVVPTAQSSTQARSARSSRGNLTPTLYTRTTVRGDSYGQDIVAKNSLTTTLPLPDGNLNTASAAQRNGEVTTPTPSSSGAKNLMEIDHVKGPEPPKSHVQLPHEYGYNASPFKDSPGPTADASMTHSLSSDSVSSASEIITSPIPKTLTTRRPLFAALPGIDLYFSLEASSSLHVPAGPISSGTIALTEIPSSASLLFDVRSTCVDVAAMAVGEEFEFEALADGTGGALVEMLLRNSKEGGGGVRVVCEWSR